MKRLVFTFVVGCLIGGTASHWVAPSRPAATETTTTSNAEPTTPASPASLNRAHAPEAKLRATANWLGSLPPDHDFAASSLALLPSNDYWPRPALKANLIAWAERDGEAAIGWVLEHAPPKWHEHLFRQIAASWIWADPRAFYDWYRPRARDLSAFDRLTPSIVPLTEKLLAKRDPVLAVLLDTHQSDHWNNSAIDTIRRELDRVPDQHALLAELQSLAPPQFPEFKRSRIDLFIRHVSENITPPTPDPVPLPIERAERALTSASPSERGERIFYQQILTFAEDRPTAAAWAESLPAAPDRQTAREALVFTWSEHDPKATLDYIDALTVTPAQKQALLEIAATAPVKPASTGR